MNLHSQELKKENDTMKDENIQLKTNINTLKDENKQLKTENQQLKVSQYCGYNNFHGY